MPVRNSDPIAITVRRATPADIVLVCAWERTASTVSRPPAAYDRELSNEHGASFMALDDAGRVCGHVLGVIVTDELHIHDLATQKDVRRRRIASRLIDTVIAYAVSQGAQTAYLEVRSKNHAAISLYEKCGFCVQLIRRKYYSDDGDDALIMAKNIGATIRTS